MLDSEPVLAKNIRTLLQKVADGIDLRIETYRKGTEYEHMRRSDVRLFVLAVTQPRTMAELARIMKVSRQAIHSSVKRLGALKLVALEPIPGNHRDKQLIVTEHGHAAIETGARMIREFEEECAAIIGRGGLEDLRQKLAAIDSVIGRDAPIHADLKSRPEPGDERPTEL